MCSQKIVRKHSNRVTLDTVKFMLLSHIFERKEDYSHVIFPCSVPLAFKIRTFECTSCDCPHCDSGMLVLIQIILITITLPLTSGENFKLLVHSKNSGPTQVDHHV
jgi:hypothetical protein